MKKNHEDDRIEKQIFSDVTIPAFFQVAKKQITITPHKEKNGLVTFIAEGVGITEALEDLYKNPAVPVLDYIRALKTLRSAIFTLKGAGK